MYERGQNGKAVDDRNRSREKGKIVLCMSYVCMM